MLMEQDETWASNHSHTQAVGSRTGDGQLGINTLIDGAKMANQLADSLENLNLRFFCMGTP